MKTFTRASCKALSTDVLEALEGVGKKHGVSFSRASGSYDSTAFTFKLVASFVDETGTARTPELVELEKRHPELAGARVTLSAGKEGTVIGYRARAPKRPFMVKTDDGKTFVVPHHMVGVEPPRDRPFY